MTDVKAVSREGSDVAIEGSAIEALSEGLRGDVLTPQSRDYESSRLVWNGMIDRRPALIARCSGTADVVDAVDFAREHDLLVAVRGGGHNVAGFGTCDGGIVIDLSGMHHVAVDPEARTAWVEPGARLIDLDRETQLFGLATPAGVISDTGMAGLTLGGGQGHLARKYGLSCDSLRSAQVVTAGGEVVRAAEDENADLFWGLRGGGGNFGIVTEFEFDAYKVGPEVAACLVFYPIEAAEQVFAFFRDWFGDGPDEVSAIAVTMAIPEEEPFPRDLQGAPTVAILAANCGPADAGERTLMPLRQITEPLLDMSTPMPFVMLQTLLDQLYPSHDVRYYWKSTYVDGLSDDVIGTIIERYRSTPSPLTSIDAWAGGGAIAQVGEDETAFSGRQKPFLVNIEASWLLPEEDQANVNWARGTWSALREFSSDGAMYFNFPGALEEGQELMRSTFGQKYERLARLKAKYDPSNMFRLNQNIEPLVG